MVKMKPSKESRKTKYYVRALKRISSVAVWLFILFCIVMFIIWAVPKIWHWALG
jgi:preprotein translocase subunit SecG